MRVEKEKKAGREGVGNDLLSPGVAPSVPSALANLTAGFGMEPGVASPPKSPKQSHQIRTIKTTESKSIGEAFLSEHPILRTMLNLKPSTISTAWLSTLLHLHRPPI